MPYLQDENFYMRPPGRGERYEPGLTNYAAHNATAMAAPFELNPDDIARLDEDISTHAFKDSLFPPRQPSPFVSKFYGTIDKENHPYEFRAASPIKGTNFGLRPRENLGRLAAEVADAVPSSDPYVDLSPLQLRRSTSDHARQKVITPPTSSSPQIEAAKLAPPPHRRALQELPPQSSRQDDLRLKPNSTFEELQQIFEQRLDLIKKTEAEKYAALEIEYKRQIAKLEADLDLILKKQEDMMRMKSHSDLGLQKDLDRAKQELRHEHELWKQERSKYEAKIKGLQAKVEDLQRRLKKHTSSLDSFDGNKSSGVIRKYESKFSDLQHDYDQKTSELIKQFEREKQSALQIMKTRIKSEINLLVPRIRQQCQSAFNQALTKCQEQTAQRYREKYGGIIKKLKEEHQAEKRFIQKQARDDVEHEKNKWQRKIKAKYEMKVLEVKNECEKRLIDRMKTGRSKPSNVSFASEMTTLHDDSMFTDSDMSSFLS